MTRLSVLWVVATALSAIAQETSWGAAQSTGVQSVTQAATSSYTVDPSESPSSTSTISTHTINVGAAGHKFTPEQTTVPVGDIIEYRFYPKEHWVIRGDYDHPCIPYEYVGTNRRGFSSGLQPVEAITDDAPRFRVRVNDTEPIFFYCGAPGSCVNYHMIGVINPSSNMTLDGTLAKANDVDYQLTPGEPWPSEGSDGPDGNSTTTGNGDNNNNQPSKKSGLSVGAIVGIAVGGAAAAILAAAACFFLGRRRRRNQTAPNRNTSMSMGEGPPMEDWSQSMYGIGKPGPPMGRHSHQTTSMSSQSPPPVSPHSLSHPYSYQYQHPGPVPHNNPMPAQYDPHFAAPAPQYTNYTMEAPRQERLSPIELPSTAEARDGGELDGESRFSHAPDPSNQGFKK